MTYTNNMNIEYPENPEFTLLKTKSLPEDMIEIAPENKGAVLARLWQSPDPESNYVYLEVLEPKVCVEIWHKPAMETAWLSFFVTRFENAGNPDTFVAEKGIYQLSIGHGNPDNLGPVQLELYLQP